MAERQDREAHYQSEVMRNAYRLRLTVEFVDGAMYLVRGSERALLCRPLASKNLWYETWLALKERYGDLPQFIRTPGGRTK